MATGSYMTPIYSRSQNLWRWYPPYYGDLREMVAKEVLGNGTRFYSPSLVTLAVLRNRKLRAGVVAPSINGKCNQATRHVAQSTKWSHTNDATKKAVSHE
ncbi:hypothetical protein TNCV_4461101 [Trichonephila clavipes]|nr:hypothetical protein TNCV_4461101 [Trichonephila clavipes]